MGKPHDNYRIFLQSVNNSDAGSQKTLGVPVVIGGDNLPSPVWIKVIIEKSRGEGSLMVQDTIDFFFTEEGGVHLLLGTVPRKGME